MTKKVRIKQRDLTDCGAACLCSVAAFYNLRIPVSKVRQYAGTDRRGTNVLGMIEAASKMGLEARGARGSDESLKSVPLPAIAHLIKADGLHHYVVLYKVGEKKIRYMDPGDGRFTDCLRTSFLSEWSGVIILLAPGDSFKQANLQQSNITRFLHLISPHKMMMLQALVGALVFTVLGLASSIYVQKIIDHVLTGNNLPLLNLMSVVMIVLLLFQTVIGGMKSILALQTGQYIDARLILGYYKHLLSLPQRFFDTMRVGEIISRVNDAVKIRAFVNDVALEIIVNILITGLSVAMMFLFYWKLALIMLAIIPVYTVLFLISRHMSRKQQRLLMEDSARLETQLVESITAAGTIKRFALEDYANVRTEAAFTRLLKTIYRAGISGISIANASEFVTRLFTIIILWSGSYFVISRDLSPGELLSFYALIGYLTGPALSLISASRNIQDALIAADRLYEIIDLEAETANEYQVKLGPDDIGDIVFDRVSFRYGSRGRIFEDLSLVFKKGSATAIVGSTGSGKSTLMSLLQNLYPLSGGSIRIGANDLKHIDNSSLRRLISVVPQEIELFAGTIAENIALGEYEPDLRKILSICELIGLKEFIENLPQHYHTVLNEQGVNLSGGQRQKIALARALYRNPEILILDEATSSLDPSSEKLVQDALSWFHRQGKTLIIIAHRLSTIKNCDTILVLENGKITEAGSHNQLMQSGLSYPKLWAHHLDTVGDL